METKRGTGDPTYLYYTLGKLEIMKLREDLKKKQGAAFSLKNSTTIFLQPGLSARSRSSAKLCSATTLRHFDTTNEVEIASNDDEQFKNWTASIQTV